jgi:hypothetical protein
MKGEIKIRLGNDSQAPMVVYVSNKNSKFNLWTCEVLNTGDTVFSKDENLIDFDYNKFKIIYYKWKISYQDLVKNRFIELLDELEKQLDLEEKN